MNKIAVFSCWLTLFIFVVLLFIFFELPNAKQQKIYPQHKESKVVVDRFKSGDSFYVVFEDETFCVVSGPEFLSSFYSNKFYCSSLIRHL